MYVDLTMEVSPRTPVYPGDPAILVETVAEFAKDGWNERRLICQSHVSTHIDAPFHMQDDGQKLDDFPIESFIGPAQIIDARGHNPIKAEHLSELDDSKIVLLRTDHTKKAFEG